MLDATSTANILSIVTFATSKNGGIVLTAREAQDARAIAGYALAIMFTTLLAVWMLPGTPFVVGLQMLSMTKLLLIAASLLTLAIFSALAFHAIHHVHPTHYSVVTTSSGIISSVSIIRWIVEALLALGIALGGVIVMVILTLGALICVLRRRVSQVVGIFLLLIYAAWVVVHAFM